MTTEKGLVSVIIPVFNRPGMLCEAVSSVFEQDYEQLEVIVVDDGSTDGTPYIIEELSSEFGERFRATRIENGGPGAAREAGRAMVSGEFIQHLDSDDLLLPGKLSRQVALLNAHPECGIAYGKTVFQRVGEELDYVAYKGTGEQRESLFPSMLAGRWWSTSTPLFRCDVCDQAGPWLPLRNEEDWEYDCRVARIGVRLIYIDEFVSVTRSHAAGHACEGGDVRPDLLRDRCLARIKILQHALDGGVPVELAEFQHFLRGSFLVARQAAAHGISESQQLVGVIYAVSPRVKIRIFRQLSKLLGDARAARMASFLYGIIRP